MCKANQEVVLAQPVEPLGHQCVEKRCQGVLTVCDGLDIK